MSILLYTDGDERERGRVGAVLIDILRPHDKRDGSWIEWREGLEYHGAPVRIRCNTKHMRSHTQCCNHCTIPIKNRTKRRGRCETCFDSRYYSVTSGEYEGVSYRDMLYYGLDARLLPPHERVDFEYIRARSCSHCYTFIPDLSTSPPMCDVCFGAGHCQLESGRRLGRSVVLEAQAGYEGLDCSDSDRLYLQRAKRHIEEMARVDSQATDYTSTAALVTREHLRTGIVQLVHIPPPEDDTYLPTDILMLCAIHTGPGVEGSVQNVLESALGTSAE